MRTNKVLDTFDVQVDEPVKIKKSSTKKRQISDFEDDSDIKISESPLVSSMNKAQSKFKSLKANEKKEEVK